MLDDVHIWERWGPRKYCDVIFLEPVPCPGRSVLQVVVLLENDGLWVDSMVRETHEKVFIEYFAVLDCIQSALNAMEAADTC